MAPGPPPESLTEDESKELITIHKHIRSLSTLGYILRVNSTFPTSPRKRNEVVATNNIVEMLDWLAQCLVRERIENASVGIVAKGHILASPLSISQSGDKSGGEAFVKELNFNGLSSATNSEGTVPKPRETSLADAERHKLEEPRKQRTALLNESLRKGEGSNLKWPTVSKLVYQYRSQNKSREYGSRATARPSSYPSFHLHAVVCFDFLKSVLQDWHEDGEEADERRTANQRSFCMFVTGMSFAKLGYRLQDPPASSCATSVTEYLTKPLSSQDFQDVKNAWVKDEELDLLQRYFNCAWTAVPQHEKTTNSDLRNAIDQLTSNNEFTTLIAAACHLMLRTLFRLLRCHYDYLDAWEPRILESADHDTEGSQLFEEYLPEILFALQAFEFFAYSEVMQHFKRSTKAAPSKPGSPKHQQSPSDTKRENSISQHPDEGEDDEFDDLSWQDVFVSWLRRLVRQYSSARRLSRLKDTWRSKISKLDMGIVLEHKADNKMQPWRDTIKDMCKSDSTRLDTCMRITTYLATIEQNVRGNMDHMRSLWAPLVKGTDSKAWDECFWGTIHGEAAIAAVYAQNKEPYRLPFYGVSKHCCLCCATLIETVASQQHFPPSSAHRPFLGRSHKWWRWALPSDCPLKVARTVSKALDKAMYEVLEASADELCRLSKVYNPGSSHDEIDELCRLSKLYNTGSSHDETSRGNWEEKTKDVPYGFKAPPRFDPEGKIRSQS